jgi:serine protease Do
VNPVDFQNCRSSVEKGSGTSFVRDCVPAFVMTGLRCVTLVIVGLIAGASAPAQSTDSRLSADVAAVRLEASRSSTLLRDLDSSLEKVVAKVSPAVVQITVTGYGPSEEHGHTDTSQIVRQHAIGAGVIIDPDGYIITNAHVVEGAQRIRVILPPPTGESAAELQPIHAEQILDATVVGTHKESDLALLKVQASHLPTVPLRTDVRVRQGELVFAIGSPEGLRDSVSMGVVSSVARQTNPDNPMIYLQTDAAINPGNSGGPLVDIDGDLVGINTFILTEGGGSEGLGFAIPAAIVNFDYQSLRKNGYVQRVAIGAKAQNITPTLAAGLGLARSWGAIISDVAVGGSAEAAGVQVQDIVLAIDDRPIAGLPDFTAALYLHPADRVLKIDLLRATNRMSLNVPVRVHHEKMGELADIPEMQKSLIRKLSIFVTELDGTAKQLLHDPRSDSGVVVVAQAAGSNGVNTGLETADIIRAIDGAPLQSISQLRAIVPKLKPGDPVVLQIERKGKLQYLAFEMD